MDGKGESDGEDMEDSEGSGIQSREEEEEDDKMEEKTPTVKTTTSKVGGKRRRKKKAKKGLLIYYCDVKGCKYETKFCSDVKRHKANIHDIGAIYHECNFNGCNYKAKQVTSLRRHKQALHPEREQTAADYVDVDVGMRVHTRFAGGVWYKGTILETVRYIQTGLIVKVTIKYDFDGVTEECNWPDKDISVIEGDFEGYDGVESGGEEYGTEEEKRIELEAEYRRKELVEEARIYKMNLLASEKRKKEAKEKARLRACGKKKISSSSGISKNVGVAEVGEGMLVRTKFDDGEFYSGKIMEVIKGKGEVINKVKIMYEDGDEEISSWPDKDIVLTLSVLAPNENRNGRSQMNASKKLKAVNGGRNDIDRCGNVTDLIFPCDHYMCEYRAKTKGVLKRHLANIHDVDVIFHFCDQKGCKYLTKLAGDLKRHKANVHKVVTLKKSER